MWYQERGLRHYPDPTGFPCRNQAVHKSPLRTGQTHNLNEFWWLTCRLLNQSRGKVIFPDLWLDKLTDIFIIIRSIWKSKGFLNSVIFLLILELVVIIFPTHVVPRIFHRDQIIQYCHVFLVPLKADWWTEPNRKVMRLVSDLLFLRELRIQENTYWLVCHVSIVRNNFPSLLIGGERGGAGGDSAPPHFFANGIFLTCQRKSRKQMQTCSQ